MALFSNVKLSRALKELVDNGHTYYQQYEWPQGGPQSIDELSALVAKAEKTNPDSRSLRELRRILAVVLDSYPDRNKHFSQRREELLKDGVKPSRAILGDINKELLIIEYPAIDKKLVLPGTLISFADRITPSFHKEQVYGRMDPIVSYQNTARSMTFSWEIDFSTGDSSWAYAALNDLAKMMYPVYQDACANQLGTGTLVAAPLLRFSLRSADGGSVKLLRSQQGTGGKTINGVLGAVDSFDYVSMDAKRGNFTMMRTPGATMGNNILPAMLTVNFGITVLHEGSKVGWVWSKSESGREVLVFGQGEGFPYGVGSTLDVSTAGQVAATEDAQDDSRSASDATNRNQQAAGNSVLSEDKCGR
jgi:hypothetical protein